MNVYTPEQFFDLSAFPFADLFSADEPVWKGIADIDAYITSVFAQGKLTPNYKGRTDVFIGEGTIIDDYVSIEGPAIIGNNCHLRHASLIRNGCILGNNVTIGHAAEIKHSIFLNDSSAAHLNYIGDSIIGNRVNISGGAMAANFRLDKRTIMIKRGDEKIDTGLVKFGAVIGDNSIIGVNSVLNPGTILGKQTVVYPLVSARGTHEAGEVIKA